MAAQVFYRKWRPQILADLVGQELVTRTLLNALNSERVSHAYLFYGPRGTGKTSTARILAKAVNCLKNGKGEPCNTCDICQAITEGRAIDIIEIDAASNTGVDNIRDLREKVHYAPGEARHKVYIIDEVHMLSTSASNALLKTLEEPPPHAIFILATTEIHKVLPTIISRCQRFDFRRIAPVDIVSRLIHISQSESIEIEPKALQLIAKSATGSLRDAENLLEQLTTYYGSVIKLHQVQDTLGMTGDTRTKELAEHIVDRDIVAGMNTINDIHSDGLDLKQFNRELVAYLRGLLLTKTGSSEALDLTCEDIAEMKDLAAKASLDQILQAVKLFNQIEFSFDNYTSLPLELALMDCVLPKELETEITPNEDDKSKPHKQTRKAVSKTGPTSIVNPVSKLVEPITEPAEISVTAADLTPTMASSKTTVPVQPEAPVTASVSPIGELERIQQNWKQIVAQAPEDIRKTAATAILRSAGVKPVALEDNTITLAFKYSYHMEKIEESENQRITEKIIGNFLGHSCRVRCVFQPANNHLVREAQKMGAQITSVEEK